MSRLGAALLLAAGASMARAASEAPVAAAAPPERWTYWVDLGANFAGTTAVDSPTAFEGVREVRFDAGVRMDLGIGYRPVPWIRCGLETGYVWNPMSALLGYEQTDGELSQVPVQGLMAVESRLWGPLGGWLGGGVGGVYARTTSGWTPAWQSLGNNQFVAGYQGFAGLAYQLGRRSHLGLQYRFAVTDRLDWDIELSSGGIQEARTDPVMNHGITVFFRAEF
jgi:opacity protein-like surface antigen